MSVKIKYNKTLTPKNSINKVLFVDDKYNFIKLKKYISSKEYNVISELIKSYKTKKNFLSFDISSKVKITLISLAKNMSSADLENLGAKFYDLFKSSEILNLSINTDSVPNTNKSEIIGHFLHGIKLKSYKFEKYKSKKNKINLSIDLIGKNKPTLKELSKFKAIEEGTFYARDLVSEPGNVLHPDEYAKRLNSLKKDGLKITIYDEKKLKKLGMNTLLGVGQGSIRGSYLVTMEWKGQKDNSKPLAFVGKGVCFDTGGISLKPAKFMEDMTYDMAGSAVVVGLMKSLALRKAKVNAVGVVGLVENMPGGNAQRPGDIVKSYSGKTVEILNTDAEGRLVLADALTYTEEKFKPKLIVDLATLTGAIIVSLGSEYAGLFSNNDKLSKELIEAGEKVEEKVWRMPLNKNFDKLIDSKNADMQNINYVGGAGSTTAAQFLQRFILNKTPWAHLDIAGMAFSKYGGALNSGGATGYGVRLLNKLIEDNYE
ncbi:leucyl aminopeptidase [Candidatus Pelagibacter sp. HIMB1695]|uniref:leucyl aminopeptidase n=1 Tax=Candidatus Pelagibacter sp. HIMB1695 TaxID=3413364 RepID=UPI003F86FCCF